MTVTTTVHTADEDINVVRRITYSDVTSVLVEVDNASPVGAMFKGTGLFLGAMFSLRINYELGLGDPFSPSYK